MRNNWRGKWLPTTQDLQAINQDLTQKESYLRALVGNAPVGIGQFDAQGRSCYLNAAGCALTACTANTALGRSFLDFVHPEHRVGCHNSERCGVIN